MKPINSFSALSVRKAHFSRYFANILYAGFFLFILSTGFIGGTGCANIIPPTGGPRDSLPPVLLKAAPANFTLHFTGNRILFTFDEYLDVKDVSQNLVVSPVPKTEPLVDPKLKTISIKLRDTLQPNTTYSFNFGKSIRDINEGNILKNFTYVFSTGSYIDSMQYSGKVILAASGKIDSTLIVMLHTETDDSAVAKLRPRYFTRLDSSGNFLFRYLRPGTYTIFALKDESGEKKYLTKSQLFAFADSPIVVQPDYKPITLYAFLDTAGQKPVKKPAAAVPKKAAKKQEKEKRLIVQLNLSNSQLDLLGNLELQFPIPLQSFDSSKLRFTDDQFNNIKSYRLLEDTNRKKITIFYTWTEGTKYHLIADKDFAEDTLGQKLLKTDTISFETKKESDYGSVRLRFTNLNLDKNPVLEFVQADVIKATYPFGSSKIYYKKLFVPGDYELRILYDDNKNGVWDPGDFYDHKQPERVQIIKQKYTIKSNWDNEADIIL